MEPLSLAAIAEATGGHLPNGQGAALVDRVVTDSREAGPGALFVCLSGPHFDGHEFAADALVAGVAGILTERPLPGVAPTVRVDDATLALGRLGRFVRQRSREWSEPVVVAVTGTNGKTGTKDLAAGALSAGRSTVCAPRSFNNVIGVPMTLLRIGAKTRAAVVEIGTNAPGEIARLAALVEPEIGVITNIAPGHLAGLGDLAGVRREKASLLGELVGRRVSVLNRDDPSFDWLVEQAPGRVVSFGLGSGADVRGVDVACSATGTSFQVEDGPRVRLAHLGRHTVLNALAALACARTVGVDLDDAAAALQRIPPPPGRLQIRQIGGLTVLDDSYNSNPASLASAVATFRELGLGERKAVVVGDMLELGPRSSELHRLAGAGVAEARPDLLLAVGRHAHDVVSGARAAGLPGRHCITCEDRSRAGSRLADWVRPGDVVLLKGSRRMALEGLLNDLTCSAAGLS